MKCVESTVQSVKENDEIHVLIENFDVDEADLLYEGVLVKVEFDGTVLETYPLQISKIFDIDIIDDKSQDDEYYPAYLVVDGELLRSTGEVITYLRCGTMDGEITSSVAENEIPTKEGQSNFGTGYEYQRVGGGAVDVVILNKWIRFEKAISDGFSDTPKEEALTDNSSHETIEMLDWYNSLSVQEKRIADGRKYYTKSEVPEKDDSKNIGSDNVSTASITEGLCGYPTAYEAAKMNTDSAEEKYGLSVETKNVTPYGLTLVITKSGEAESEELTTGSFYMIEKFDGKAFIPAEMIIDDSENLSWTMEAYMIREDVPLEMTVDWSFLYGELEKGSYRIGKDIIELYSPGNFEKGHIYGYFEIK